MSENEPKIILAAIKAMEENYQALLCCHDYKGWIFPVLPELKTGNIHLNAFCSALKEHQVRFVRSCIAFDQTAVRRRFADSPGPFYKYCMCGLLELVQPIVIHQQVAGALFLGPFRFHEPLPPGTLTAGKSVRFPALNGFRTELSRISAAALPGLAALLRLVAGEIARVVEAAAGGTLPERSVAEEIRHFMNTNFSLNITLSELADYLHLSRSRTTQLLRRELRQTFPELLTTYRLEYACRLLRDSRFRVKTIAEKCGFFNVTYFYRVFRARYGLTPRACRLLVAARHSEGVRPELRQAKQENA